MHREHRPGTEFLEEIQVLGSVPVAIFVHGRNEGQADPAGLRFQEVILRGRIAGLAIPVVLDDKPFDLDQPGRFGDPRVVGVDGDDVQAARFEFGPRADEVVI